jgi:hypothetical protein
MPLQLLAAPRGGAGVPGSQPLRRRPAPGDLHADLSQTAAGHLHHHYSSTHARTPAARPPGPEDRVRPQPVLEAQAAGARGPHAPLQQLLRGGRQPLPLRLQHAPPQLHRARERGAAQQLQLLVAVPQRGVEAAGQAQGAAGSEGAGCLQPAWQLCMTIAGSLRLAGSPRAVAQPACTADCAGCCAALRGSPRRTAIAPHLAGSRSSQGLSGEVSPSARCSMMCRMTRVRSSMRPSSSSSR